MYQNPTFGIAIQYPSNWQKVEQSGGSLSDNFGNVVSFNSPQGSLSQAPSASISLKIQDLTMSMSLGQYSTAHLNSMKGHSGNVILGSGPTTLAGQPAYKVIYTENSQLGGPTKIAEIWTIVGNRAYTILYTADEINYATYLPIGQQIVDSFVLTS